MRMEIGKLSLVVCDQNLIWSERKYSKVAFRNREFFLLESFTGRKVFMHRTFLSFNIKLVYSCGNAKWSWYQWIQKINVWMASNGSIWLQNLELFARLHALAVKTIFESKLLLDVFLPSLKYMVNETSNYNQS